MEYTIGAYIIPEHDIEAVSFEGNYDKAIVTFGDGRVEDTRDPFTISDLRDLVAAKPELLKQQEQSKPQTAVQTPTVSGTWKEARAFTQLFIRSEHIGNHEAVVAVTEQLKQVDPARADEVWSWHRGACRKRYLETKQQMCCWGDTDEAEAKAIQERMHNVPESNWH